MSDCCADGHDLPCPVCEVLGPHVGAAPVRAHRPDAASHEWRYCSNPSCHVVFFAGHETVTDSEVIAQVGSKAATKPTPVCFCFAHTADDIADDLTAHGGTSTIRASVRGAVTAGLCACEHLNPAGTCCLPGIHRTVTAERRSQHASSTPGPFGAKELPDDDPDAALPPTPARPTRSGR